MSAYRGVIFATACEDMEPVEDYLGPGIREQFDIIFDGTEQVLLGLHRNILPGNWKLYQENLKDPYHATLLHTYLTTFGLFVTSNESDIMVDPDRAPQRALVAPPAGPARGERGGQRADRRPIARGSSSTTRAC